MDGDQPVSDLGLPADWHPGQVRMVETESLTDVYDRCRVRMPAETSAATSRGRSGERR